MPRLSAKISLSMITKIVNDFVVVLRDKSFSLFKNGTGKQMASKFLKYLFIIH